MSPVSKNGGGRFLSLVLLLALGGVLIVLALQARSNRATVKGLRAELESQKTEMRGLRERMEELAGERKKEKQRADGAEEHATDLAARVSELTARVESLAANLARTAAERDEHLAVRLDLARRVEVLETALAEGRVSRQAREGELAGRIDEYEALASDLKDQVAELQGNRAEFRRRFEETAALLRTTTLKLESLTAEYQVAVDARRVAEKSVAALGADLRAALEKAVTLRGEADRLKATNAELTAARDEMARRLKDALEQMKKEAEDSPVDPTK